MFDWVEIVLLVSLNAVIDSVLGIAIGLILVAKYAGKQAQEHTETWFMSEGSDPVLDKIAARVKDRVIAGVPTEERLAAFETRVAAEVQTIDHRIHAALVELDGVLDEIPNRVKMAILSERAVETREIYAMANQAGVDLQEAGKLAMPDDMNPQMLRLRELLMRPVSEEYEEKNPLGAFIINFGKAKLVEEMGPALGLSPMRGNTNRDRETGAVPSPFAKGRK